MDGIPTPEIRAGHGTGAGAVLRAGWYGRPFHVVQLTVKATGDVRRRAVAPDGTPRLGGVASAQKPLTRLVRHARKRILKISPDWPWKDAFITCWNRLCALPAPS